MPTTTAAPRPVADPNPLRQRLAALRRRMRLVTVLFGASWLEGDEEGANLSHRGWGARHQTGNQLGGAQRHSTRQQAGGSGEKRRSHAHHPH